MEKTDETKSYGARDRRRDRNGVHVCVAGVLVSVLTMGQSLTGTLLAAGRPDRAIVLRAAATSEIASTLTLDVAAAIENAPGVARAADGAPLATSDLLGP